MRQFKTYKKRCKTCGEFFEADGKAHCPKCRDSVYYWKNKKKVENGNN